jgi:serine/threonine protein kinase
MKEAADNDQLANEIRGLSRANSRHVIEIYDVIKDASGEIQGVIIERLRGRDFNDFFKEAPTDPFGYLKILYQIATALRDLHAAGVVHRDLKLANFKESHAGIVKLFDFGISSIEGGYKTKNNKGTLVYAAPELYVSNATITPEMDIYAFGVCAWALATNSMPPALLEQPPQSTAPCASLSTVWKNGVHPEIIHLLDLCVRANPAQRPTAKVLSQTLAKHLVRGRHRGVFVQGNAKVVELSASASSATLKTGLLGELRVEYDELVFKISHVSGSVRINNVDAHVGMMLHDACLLAFGDRSLGSKQVWVTFFSSHPEVVL